MKTPIELLVRLLANGERVKCPNGVTYAMTTQGGIAVVMNEGTDDEMAIGVDCDVASLSHLADSIGKDELWLQCCSMQLRKMSNEQA